jgi:hypothetical protein
MAQISNPVEPFGEVNIHPKPDGSIDVVATILMVPDIEGARTGLALDASASMKKMYGISAAVSALFAKASSALNVVEPVARTMAAYLANFSSTSSSRLIYWAVSSDGSMIEEIGDVTQESADSVSINGPKKQQWGRGTKLLPPVKYFVETAFEKAPWALVLIVTDGKVEDLEAVKAYSLELGRQIASGKRAFIKFVLIGVGEDVDEGQMEQLDDLFEGTDIKDQKGDEIDIWDHRMASEMKKLEEIFSEVVSVNTVVAESATITNNAGVTVKEYPDGLPALLRFNLPNGSTGFVIKHPGGEIVQEIK